ncbi:hypothetical protein GCM10023317_45160 [Actinopolymorpha pittospori]
MSEHHLVDLVRLNRGSFHGLFDGDGTEVDGRATCVQLGAGPAWIRLERDHRRALLHRWGESWTDVDK